MPTGAVSHQPTRMPTGAVGTMNNRSWYMMKRVIVFENVKSFESVKRLLARNYSQYSISSIEAEKWGHYTKKVVFVFLKLQGDIINSAYALYNPNKGTLELKRDNNNKVKKYRKLFS